MLFEERGQLQNGREREGVWVSVKRGTKTVLVVGYLQKNLS